MLKKMLTSPVGIALAVAGVVLAMSPEARQATRKMVVKGTAALLGAFDSVKHTMADALPNEVTAPVAGTLSAGAGLLNTATETVTSTTKATVDATVHAAADVSEQSAEGAAQASGILADAMEATPVAGAIDSASHEFH